MSQVRARQRSADAAAAAIWIVYASIYAITFALSGLSLAVAIRSALVNAIPDGLLALAALGISRRIDRGEPAGRRLLRRYVLRGIVLVTLAGAGKILLSWIDYLVVARPFQSARAIVTWWFFLSVLIYVTIAALSHAWLIAQRLREEEAHAVRADALRARAEIAALRAQLNPHFLFNTLHSVLGLVRRDPALAEAALEKLGDLMRYATRVHRNGVDWIAFRHERDFVETYLDLEAVRLGDRLRVVRQIEEAGAHSAGPDVFPAADSSRTRSATGSRHGPKAEDLIVGAPRARRPRPQTRRSAMTVTGRAPEGRRRWPWIACPSRRLDGLYRGTASMTAGPTPAGGYSVVLNAARERRRNDGDTIRAPWSSKMSRRRAADAPRLSRGSVVGGRGGRP